MDSYTVWSSIPSTDISYNFKWYAGETNILALRADGQLTLSGGLVFPNGGGTQTIAWTGYPSQSGNNGKFLKTDGSTVSWGDPSSRVTISDTPPSSPTSGDLWWDDLNGELYIYYTNTWVRANSAGPSSPVLLRNTTIVTDATYTATSSDWYIGVNRSGPVSITLPSGIPGQELVIKDESGACSSHPITLIGNIDNDSGGAILYICFIAQAGESFNDISFQSNTINSIFGQHKHPIRCS
jgi:hypothetical protein